MGAEVVRREREKRSEEKKSRRLKSKIGEGRSATGGRGGGEENSQRDVREGARVGKGVHLSPWQLQPVKNDISEVSEGCGQEKEKDRRQAKKSGLMSDLFPPTHLADGQCYTVYITPFK